MILVHDIPPCRKVKIQNYAAIYKNTGAPGKISYFTYLSGQPWCTCDPYTRTLWCACSDCNKSKISTFCRQIVVGLINMLIWRRQLYTNYIDVLSLKAFVHFQNRQFGRFNTGLFYFNRGAPRFYSNILFSFTLIWSSNNLR